MPEELWHYEGLILNNCLLPILVHYIANGIRVFYTLCSALHVCFRAIWNSAYNGAWSSVNNSAWSFLRTKVSMLITLHNSITMTLLVQNGNLMSDF